jgi:hypothetical protein
VSDVIVGSVFIGLGLFWIVLNQWSEWRIRRARRALSRSSLVHLIGDER